MARLVVFKDPAELVELRELLYGDPEQQVRGLEKAKAYEVRGHLPPSVHVTCLLVSAFHSDVPGTDFYAIRQIYAMALIRFVNEMLDVFQVGRAVVPLHILASQMGLPSAFVELRHAATHEDIPSIYLLRDMANRATDWLMENFWSKQSEEPSSKRQKTSEFSESADVGTRVKNLLREWRRLKRQNPALKPARDFLEALQTEWENDAAEFLDVCLNRNVLVPTAGSGTPATAQLITMWLPVFEGMGRHACEELESSVLTALGTREWPLKKNEKREYPILQAWAQELAPYLNARSTRKLKSVPRPWNAKVLALNACALGDADLYKVAEEMAFLTGTEVPEFVAAQPPVPGWKLIKGWTPRPLGT